MKKKIIIIFSFFLAIFLVGCNRNDGNKSNVSTEKSSKVTSRHESKKVSDKSKETTSDENNQKSDTQNDNFSLVGTWHGHDTQITYYDDGTLKQKSTASGLIGEGSYKILSKNNNVFVIEQTVKIKNAGSNTQKITLTFSSNQRFSDGMYEWSKGE